MYASYCLFEKALRLHLFFFFFNLYQLDKLTVVKNFVNFLVLLDLLILVCQGRSHVFFFFKLQFIANFFIFYF
jgi:hypothetical protein